MLAFLTATLPNGARAEAYAPPPVTLHDFKLTGDLRDDRAVFTLNAIAHVENAGSLDLLKGTVALMDVPTNPKWRVRVEQNGFALDFDRKGEFPFQIKFAAAVMHDDNGNSVDFHIAPGTLLPVVLQGLAADTQFQFPGAALPERRGNDFMSFLPSDGNVKLSWKEARTEVEGKLFYAAEMISQISVSPGLMRQDAVMDFKVMQGELNRATLVLHGDGEVTRVQGEHVLAWNVEPITNSTDRLLTVQLNQPQKDQFTLTVQAQTPLGAFPQTADVMQLRPESATRFAGYFRIVNEGAVRLEVAQASGLSQISPEQFPENDVIRNLHATGEQRFAYRFSGADFALRIQADQILPELTVSELFDYHLGESELAIDAELELDVREAPLRELLLNVPKGYAIARINAAGMTDYFVTDAPDKSDSDVRIVYGAPVSGRQVIELRLERNQALDTTNWALPRIEVAHAKSVRGHVSVSSDAGFRLTPERTQALTEIATAFFPRKVAGIQQAFRLEEPTWEATMRVERLPQTVQADVFHLFSIGEGVAYGSSVMNYAVSGAPVSAFRVDLSDEYFNVEFTGKDIRNWVKTNGGYVVQLHTPVSGVYTLLATYERPFKAQGETLSFTGARPVDAQTEQGYTLVISAYQFQVKPANVSPGLLPLETGEVPAEYRLFFDAPILAAYRYTSRPFDLKLALSPLAQGDSLSQVVDRATISSRISKEGQVLTDVRYFVKNRGNPNFRLTLPEGTELWSASVNGAAVVPVLDGKSNLIPLPQRADPNAVLTLDLKLAARSTDAKLLSIATPTVNAPVMLAEWKLTPDDGQRLVYRRGSLTPIGGVPDISGFGQLMRLLTSTDAGRAMFLLIALLFLVGSSAILWRWTGREEAGKFSAQSIFKWLLGFVAFGLALLALAYLHDLVRRQHHAIPYDITFLAPVQQAGSALQAEVGNVPEKNSGLEVMAKAWPAFAALGVWIYARGKKRAWLEAAGWTLLAWAALRSDNGVEIFLWLLAVFFVWQIFVPAMRAWWKLPRRSAGGLADSGGAPVVAAWLIGGLILFCFAGTPAQAKDKPNVKAVETPLAQSIVQQMRVEEKFAFATAKIHWQASRGDRLPLLFEPAILTHVTFPNRAFKLEQSAGRRGEELLAQESGAFDVEVQYELPIIQGNGVSGVTLPTQFALVNQLQLTLMNLDVDVRSQQAVSVQRETSGSNTVAKLVLSPAADAWISWQPRSRDVKLEKPVFYAELSQLDVPSAGVIEGAHFAAIRPAQGELSELIFDVPPSATITDVSDAAVNSKSGNSFVSVWRFDPDARKLRVSLNPPQSRPFALMIRSQVATGPLPVEKSVGLISVENAAGQIGLLGIATGNEVQLDKVAANNFSPINLEDFPGNLAAALQNEIPGLTVRRAFRYSEVNAVVSLKASAVEPDVRVETQNTLSLGEDRTVLAVDAAVDITRAGIFRLSFVLPAGMDVESVSGAALSHWTESKGDAGSVITLHLRGKTEGQQQFALSLSGPGVKATNGWTVPQLVLREASKQRGTLVIAPEQGMRLSVASRDGVTQLDPQKSGIQQKGVLAFRILQTQWSLALDTERVDPWIQVTSLQHATINEAQVKVIANLQYQIENTGLKTFHVRLPENAESVHFQGDQVADFLPVHGAVTNGLQLWEIKLQRRVIGTYFLQASYNTVLEAQATQATLRGVQVADVNLQRGFVTLQAGGRLQLRVDSPPAALQPAEWQSIPRALQQDLPSASANFAYRLVEPSFQLALTLDRHEAAKLLQAQVNNVTLTSVISDNGAMLTEARLEILPGDKRLLKLTLPKGAKFWFAFVNQNGVWPWREEDQILIPLEQQSRDNKPIPVEIFYANEAGAAGGHRLDLDLLAPKFDLPLEDITWRVCLNDKWRLKNWGGSFQLQAGDGVAAVAALDANTYLKNEANAQREKTKAAEDMLAFGNNMLQNGDPQQARRAFQSAYGLSQGDDAFNEDARVQLNNLKLQEALVGLNVRQAAVGDSSGASGIFRDLRGRKEMAYSQQQAKDMIDRNTADDNSAFMRLAQRIIQQQDAAVSTPAAIRASIPEQGRVLTFKRAVAVDRWADLKIGLKVTAAGAASWVVRIGVLVGIFAMVVVLTLIGKNMRAREV
jgi:hypothetical protein